MKMSNTIACLAAVCVWFGQPAAAEETIADVVVEQAAEVAKEVETVAERFAQWAEQNGDEIAHWSERYSGQWEEWGERFEAKIERWAERQEHEWEQWAEEYSSKWESWGNQFAADEINSEEMDDLIKSNLEMLSKMPLGQMVDGVLREGVAELNDAPWESLDDLKNVLKKSFQSSMNNLDELEEQGTDLRFDVDRLSNDFDRALTKMLDDLATEQEKQTQKSRKKIEALKLLMEDDDLTDKQRKNFESMLETVRDTNARRIVEARKKAAKARADLEKAFARQAKNAAQQAKAAEKEAMEQAAAAKNLAKQQAKAKKNADQLEGVESKRRTFESLRSELDSLREEIQQLRSELNELKQR